MELVFTETLLLGEIPFTTSDVIAENADVEHRAIRQLANKYKKELKSMGRVTFEMLPFDTKGGKQKIKVFKFNEVQATFIITLLKNTDKVVAFKAELSRQFFAMQQELMKRRAYREVEKLVRKSLTDTIKEWPHCNNWSYGQITDLICKSVVGKNSKQLKAERGVPKNASITDIFSYEELDQYQRLENKVMALLEMELTYQQIKTILAGDSIEITLPTKKNETEVR